MSGKRGRPKGSPSKASREILYDLSREYDFDLIKKFVKLYSNTETINDHLMNKVLYNIACNNRDITMGLTEGEIHTFNETRKDLWTMLKQIMTFCYPKLKAMEVKGGGDGEGITFNITGASLKMGNES